MPTGAPKEVVDLLKTIFVFDTKFKDDVLARAKSLTPARLENLKNILAEVSVWQKQALQKIIQKDPGFYVRLVEQKRQIDKKIIDLYKTKLSQEDQKKMEIILNKMQSI